MKLERTTQTALRAVQLDPVGAMRWIMNSEPDLTIYGFDDNSEQILIETGRQELLEAAGVQFVTSSEWFSLQQPLNTPAGGIYSHILRDEITDYATSKLGHSIQIQEGIIIAAALQMGYPVDGTCGGSALIGVQQPKPG